jgi:S-DNA-T family DNA segregation ATPase FtsK/SpoIIIE
MVSIDRTFDRNVMREFDNRILFQMSAADSSNLIDNPAANKLGPHRALVYSEEQGTMERFRPYALPDTTMLSMVHGKLAARAVE